MFFLPFPKQFQFLTTFILSSANAFNLDKSKISSFGRELITLYNMAKFKIIIQTESICRRQFHSGLMMQLFFDKVQNFVGKRQNAGYQHFLLFPQCFQTASSSGALKGVIYGTGITLLSRDKLLDLFK